MWAFQFDLNKTYVPLGRSGLGSMIQDASDDESFDAPWSEWPWIINSDPDHPKGTHPKWQTTKVWNNYDAENDIS